MITQQMSVSKLQNEVVEPALRSCQLNLDPELESLCHVMVGEMLAARSQAGSACDAETAVAGLQAGMEVWKTSNLGRLMADKDQHDQGLQIERRFGRLPRELDVYLTKVLGESAAQ